MEEERRTIRLTLGQSTLDELAEIGGDTGLTLGQAMEELLWLGWRAYRYGYARGGRVILLNDGKPSELPCPRALRPEQGDTKELMEDRR